MNNSEPTLTQMEEKLTAYLDGTLSLADASAFEKEHPDVVVERRQHERLRTVLKKVAPALSHGDFFNHQILREIRPEHVAAPAKRTFFPLWRLAFAAAACLLVASGIYFGAVGPQKNGSGEYFAQVLSVKAGDADISAHIIDAGGMAVVWIDGLDSLPNNYVLE